MAETARTAETRDALRRLADRFARLAESRIVGPGGALCEDRLVDIAETDRYAFDQPVSRRT